MGRNLDVLIMGGGPSGLAAGYVLTKEGKSNLAVVEKDSVVGGLSRTIVKGDFRFDLGGHRFFTKLDDIRLFVEDLMGGELVLVPRVSKIYLNKKFFDYPLSPANAIFSEGIFKTFRIILEYGFISLKNLVRKPRIESFEDWTVNKFGRTLFNQFFKNYTEKVWGVDCSIISADWAAARIRGLSLKVAIKNAFFKSKSGGTTTLINEFLYPSLGIGRISERFREEIGKDRVWLNTKVVKVNREDFKITSVEVERNGEKEIIEAENFISSIPLTELVTIMEPKAPKSVIQAAKNLGYRDMVIVTIMINKERAVDNTWMYFPEKDITFGRIHEPKNWSVKMAPEGKTSLVLEYFCFEGDEIWNKEDKEIINLSTKHLVDDLGMIKKEEVLGSVVLRIRRAYPMYKVGYKEHYDRIIDYIKNFKNLRIIGRGGTYRYLNIDHAIKSGIEAADNIIGETQRV